MPDQPDQDARDQNIADMLDQQLQTALSSSSVLDGDGNHVVDGVAGSQPSAPAAAAPAPTPTPETSLIDFMPTVPGNPFMPSFGGSHHDVHQASLATDEPTPAAMDLMRLAMGDAATADQQPADVPAGAPAGEQQAQAQPREAEAEDAEQLFDGKLEDLFAEPTEDAEAPTVDPSEQVFQLTQAEAARVHADPALRGLGRTMLTQHQEAEAKLKQERQAWEDAVRSQEVATKGMKDLIAAIRTPEGFTKFLRDVVDRPQGQNLVYSAFKGAFMDERGAMRPGAADILLDIGMANPDLIAQVAEQLKTFEEHPDRARMWQERRAVDAERRRLEVDRELHIEQVTTAEMARADTALRRMAKDAGLFQSTTDLLARRLTNQASEFYDPQTGGIKVPEDYMRKLVAEERDEQERYVRARERESMEEAARQAQSKTKRQAKRQATQRQRRVPAAIKAKRTTASANTQPASPNEGAGIGPMMDWALQQELQRQAAARA